MERLRWMLDWLACGLVKVIGGLFCLFPPSVGVWVGERLGDLAAWCQPTRARIGVKNLLAAFHGTLSVEQSRRIIRACYRQLGAGMVELLRLPVIDRAYIDRYLAMEGAEYLERAIADGRPVIALTAHYGNWELASILGAFRGYPPVAVARAQKHFPRLYRLLISYRESKGCTIVHKGGAMRRLMAALDQRRLVGIVGDQASRQGIFVDFFGRPAQFATGPFELAYLKRAVLVPAFIHRVRGPFHRLVIEPPIELSHEGERGEAIHNGVAWFAELLRRHVTEDPTQWLWMHNRWKRTPARRLLVLSDGKMGHLKQSLAVVEALRQRCPTLSHEVVDIRYRHRLARTAALLWSWWMPKGVGAVGCLRWALSPDSAAALLGRDADLIVSCGASTAPVNLLWAAQIRAKSVMLMNPSPLPLRRFALVIAPKHDHLPPCANVVETLGALVKPMSDEALDQAQRQLLAHPNFRVDHAMESATSHRTIAVFIGGDTADYVVQQPFVEALMAHVRSACEAVNGQFLVTTSRRTSAVVERWLSDQLSGDARCRLLLIATRDPLNGTMEGMLGSAAVAVVTGESISMVSEACASGRPVVVVEPPRCRERRKRNKHQQFLHELAHQARMRLTSVNTLDRAIRECVATPRVRTSTDDFLRVQDAVARLL